jgi:hypothetical protein
VHLYLNGKEFTANFDVGSAIGFVRSELPIRNYRDNRISFLVRNRYRNDRKVNVESATNISNVGIIEG